MPPASRRVRGPPAHGAAACLACPRERSRSRGRMLPPGPRAAPSPPAPKSLTPVCHAAWPAPATPHPAGLQPTARGPRLGSASLPSQQFQVLFDPLFKVLFIFPSRYLSAIGLSPVFCLGWGSPPASGCTPKQPDSSHAPLTLRAGRRPPTGLSPARALLSSTTWAAPRAVCAACSGLHLAASLRRFPSRARPASLAVTEGIPVGFFSSA